MSTDEQLWRTYMSSNYSEMTPETFAEFKGIISDKMAELRGNLIAAQGRADGLERRVEVLEEQLDSA